MGSYAGWVSRIDLVEVSPRDGLQNDPARLTTEQKVELVSRCVSAGLRRVEVASFVDPRRVPAMADASDVVLGVRDRCGSQGLWIGLVLNERGFHRALAAGVDEVNCVVGVTDEFATANQGMSTKGAIEAAGRIVPIARAAGLRTSVTLSVAFGCPFAGEVGMDRVRWVAAEVAAAQPDEVALGDTIGVAVPRDVAARVATVRAEVGPARLRVHLHNTRNTGYASALAAADAGVAALDASLGGLGGCPFAPRATGNIATEDLVYALERSGWDTGVDLDALITASDWLAGAVGRPLPALLPRAGGFPHRR